MTDKIVPVALRLWLFFLFAFLLVGYEVVPSVVFGAIAGLAGGAVNAWWSTPGGEPTEVSSGTFDKLGERFQVSSQRFDRLKKRFPILGLFGRRDQRYSRSRR